MEIKDHLKLNKINKSLAHTYVLAIPKAVRGI